MVIDIDKKLLIAEAELRRQAEERLQGRGAEPRLPRTEQELQRLVHELEVHQVELEMQNAELRQARDDMEAMVEKYTDLYDFSPAGYFTLDRHGVVLAANITAATMLGVDRSRLLGCHFGLFLADEFRPFFADFIANIFARPDKGSCEVTLKREGKTPLIIYIEAVAFESGEECRVAAIDISRRREYEDALAEKQQELEELNSSLAVRVAEDLETLRRKDQMLIVQDRMAIMGEMINNIAHQWRQPLNTLGLVIQELPLSFDSADFNREFLEQSVAKGMELIQHMSCTIEDFRNFFRSDKEVVPFSINQLLVRTLAMIGKSFKDQQIAITLQTQGEPIVNGYPNEYAQVVLNILMNARDALLDKRVAAASISIQTFTEGGRAVMIITDNGGGIDAGIIDRLFDPYFTTKGPDKGTGIGLFMSKTIIEKNMGGRLTVRNTGGGAEFRVEV